MSEFALTSNKLPIPNPYRFYGRVLIVLGLALAGMVALRLPQVYGEFSTVLRNLSESLALSERDWKIFSQGWFVVLGSVCVFCALLGGIRHLAHFFVPNRVPRDLHNTKEVVPNLFEQRAIDTFKRPAGPLKWAAYLVSKRFIYATPCQKRLIHGFFRGSFYWTLLVGSAFLVLPTDLFLICLATGLVSVGTRLLALLACIPPEPNVAVVENRAQLVNSGNPINFFNHLQKHAEEMREGDFPNRKYPDLLKEPVVRRIQKGETDNYIGDFVFETQPMPAEQLFARSAARLDVGGALLILFSFAAVFFGDAIANDSTRAVGHAQIKLWICNLALLTGLRLLWLGKRYHRVFRFRSDLFRVKMAGSYTASGIGIGDGRGGQLYSERVSIQSDTHVASWGSRVTTECDDLEYGLRFVVDSATDEEFKARFGRLHWALQSYQDSGSKLAEIDLTNQTVSSIVKANAEISALLQGPNNGAPQARIGPGSSSPVPPALPAPSNSPLEPALENKQCPECGEQVKAVAKKCRFCGYRFDQDPTPKT